jgi:hypothetical protein
MTACVCSPLRNPKSCYHPGMTRPTAKRGSPSPALRTRQHGSLPHQSCTLAILLTLSCAAHLPGPARSALPNTGFITVPYEPPPGRVEMVPAQPRRGAVWIDGEWTWNNRRWEWIPGRWVLAPPNCSYSPWVIVRSSDATLHFAPASWRDARGNPIASPAPLTSAGVAMIPIIRPDGTQARSTLRLPD